MREFVSTSPLVFISVYFSPCLAMGGGFFKTYFMSKRPPTRFASTETHAEYGVNNWFNLRGIKDNEVRKELIYVFCKEKGFDMGKIEKRYAKYLFIDKQFTAFANFAINYCIENNYEYKKAQSNH